MKPLLIIAGVLLFGSCSVFEDEQDLGNPEVVITALSPELHVVNKTYTPIFFIVIERETSYLIDFEDPCINNANLGFSARSQRSIPYQEIAGWHEGAEEAWYWWGNCQGLGESGLIKL